MIAHENVRPALPMPITATPYRHQIEAFNFVCGLFGLLPGLLGDLLGAIPFLDVGIPAVLSLYFDWFSGFMQAFIFCMLTTLYIANAAEE